MSYGNRVIMKDLKQVAVFAPVLSVVPLQLLFYYMSVEKGWILINQGIWQVS